MKAIRYQAAGGVVVDERDRVLVLRRPSRDEVRLPKGHVEKGESHLEAALREVTEESGYTGLAVLNDLGHQVVRFEYKGRRVMRDEYYFLFKLQDARQIERAAQELQFVPDWIGWDQALVELSYAAEREWVRRAQMALTSAQEGRQKPHAAPKTDEMQGYNRSFARVYNLRWNEFSQRVAPHIEAFYESTLLGQQNRNVLDVCCGTGQLAVHFLEQGYHVTGLDLSEEMLHHARQNAAPYVERGQARFVQGDAAAFCLSQPFGLAISTFDALNHLPDKESLRASFQCVRRTVLSGGTFIFDLNTRTGLRSGWNGVGVQDTKEATIINRGFYDDETGKAWVKISGYLPVENGLYERFEQVAYNTAFDLAWVQATMREDGWQRVHIAKLGDLFTPLSDPEAEHRVFFVATR